MLFVCSPQRRGAASRETKIKGRQIDVWGAKIVVGGPKTVVGAPRPVVKTLLATALRTHYL